MKTPCEKLGYKVGDEFVVSSKNYRTRKIGTLLKLAKDDGSTQPIFKTCEGEISCPHLDWVTPLAKNDQLTPQTTTKPDIIARLTQAVKAPSDLPALISELNALLPEGYEVVRTTEVTTQVTTEDMGDWRNWREGDFITIDTEKSYRWWTKGKTYKVLKGDDGDLVVAADDGGMYVIDGRQIVGMFKFHSRPSKEAR